MVVYAACNIQKVPTPGYILQLLEEGNQTCIQLNSYLLSCDVMFIVGEFWRRNINVICRLQSKTSNLRWWHNALWCDVKTTFFHVIADETKANEETWLWRQKTKKDARKWQTTDCYVSSCAGAARCSETAVLHIKSLKLSPRSVNNIRGSFLIFFLKSFTQNYDNRNVSCFEQLGGGSSVHHLRITNELEHQLHIVTNWRY